MLHRRALAVLIALMLAPAALAQTKGPNGGLLAGKDGHQTELLVSETELVVFIIDHGKPHDTKGLKLKAVVQQSGKATSVDLANDGKRMVGKLATPLGKGAIVVLTGRDDHGDVISTRYVIN
jgi:hypothetical protein